jgi:hypothetical protein
MALRPPTKKPTGEINPDGVAINIVWADLVVGASVFVPAINITKLIYQMRHAAKVRGMQLKWAERIESGKLGARFWRML